MSQSDQHKELIATTATELSSIFPNLILTTDSQSEPGDPIPRRINGFRPDLVGTIASGDFFVVAEAKTDRDLENCHTLNQIWAFATYLEKKRNGVFVLAVAGLSADRAKTTLRFAQRALRLASTRMAVFDSLDLWWLDKGGRRWHFG